MFDQLPKLRRALARMVGELDSDTLHPKTAVDLLKEFSEIEKLAGAGKSLAASRVASSGTWRKSGSLSAAHFVSRATGDLVGQAVTSIETARRMRDLPATDRAYRSGKLTQIQAAEIASAASVAPQQEHNLLEVAQTEGTAKLREVSARVKAAACREEAEKAERLHRHRSLRTWTEADGAFWLDARMTPEAGARVKSVLDVVREELFEQARRQGRKETYEALGADALEEMAARAQSKDEGSLGEKTLTMIRVDFDALNRGHTNNGEVCEIPGVGPISVASARSYLGEGFYKLLVTKGQEVKTATSHSRYIPAGVRTALVERDPECVVEGCHQTKQLEIDHVIGYSSDGPTCVDNLVRLCRPHHRLKTYKNFRLKRTAGGRWRLEAPANRGARASPRRE